MPDLGEPIHERFLHAEIRRLEDVGAERDRRYEQRFTDMERATSAALAAAEKAVDKSDTASEKRFDGVNEFRDQLKDQAATFITRSEAEAALARNATDIKALTDRFNQNGGRTPALIAVVLAATGIISAVVVIATH